MTHTTALLARAAIGLLVVFGLTAGIVATWPAEQAIEPERARKLATVTTAARLAEFGTDLTTNAAQYCRNTNGSPFGGSFCDYGPCAPCQPAGWPCSVRTVLCSENTGVMQCGWGR